MREVGFKVTGVNEVVRDLLALGLDLDDLKGAFSEIAKEGAAKAADYAPRRTGTLAASVRGNRAKNKAVVLAGRSGVPYAGPINYGWPKHHISASGFMQKASRDMEPVAVRRLEDEVNRRIRARGLA